ncbi:methyltransferase domain-containing protein [Agrobacterium vitis]|uniref:SAM-dependent methyltransferase n=1 Tax=Rhizobium/Agrobacterium group TaxID=227290 RepID=UPI0008DC0253|nr:MULTISPECIES: cyclopropane-fatty-acyl-phospholipid synthase family protein [Rhizobium/Agrobacterium group]MCF1434772.1 class I SAM-dependent methyltransferase [Allorhizobium ampelinum]MUO88278.1 methyltransferase domain-containing protein [Agrobacterium vitis]MUZ53676.1 methyltransferase domain-containing protein [Agrobacterium vitis]MUZ93391.1 methyltransferase domain-containing protein [Agrobacterium vitis]MVA40971.1 methyltransferase domain-containing protein [Agrobacterium vitis]
MASSLRGMLTRIIRKGTLEVIGADGQTQRFGDGSGSPIAIHFFDDQAEDEIYRDAQLKLGEIYMQGRMAFEKGDIYDLLALVKTNTLVSDLTFPMVWRGLLRVVAAKARGALPVNRNRRNVAHHYDLSAKLFDLFLDEDWQYSCAYFNPPGISLEEAQLAKKRHIAAKLMAEPGQRVLEIGSGWGGMAIYLAETCGVDVSGITLSEEQLKVSRERARKRGLGDRLRFDLQDYRTLKSQPFDRLVSVGMFEHVGPTHYRHYFRKVHELMQDDGVMILHSIGQPYPALYNNPFFEKYIFPGGYIPSLAEVLPAIEKSGLLVADCEILPMHYAHTLRHWRNRFMARREEAARLYDERFVRMWEFYLAGSEMAFTHEDFFIFQLQITKKRMSVPDNRDYIAAREEALRAVEALRAPLEKVLF